MGAWRFATATTVGVSHVRAGLPCQDRVACVSPDGVLIAVVADGAGSAEHSDEGADLVVRTVLESLRLSPSLDDPAACLRSAVSIARDAVFRLADERATPAREFASTVLAVVATDTTAACAHLGDGIIVVSEGAPEWSWVFWPERGEYANTTRFLTDPDALECMNVEGIRSSITDFALMSDGLEPLAVVYATRGVHDPFFNALFAPLHESTRGGHDEALSAFLTEFLQSPRVTSRVDDDLSIIIATRRASRAPVE